MTRAEAVALAMLQAGTDPSSRFHQHIFHEIDKGLLLDILRERAQTRVEEAERFLVILHEHGYRVVDA